MKFSKCDICGKMERVTLEDQNTYAVFKANRGKIIHNIELCEDCVQNFIEQIRKWNDEEPSV